MAAVTIGDIMTSQPPHIIIVYYAEAAKTIQYNKAQSEYTKNYRNYRKV